MQNFNGWKLPHNIRLKIISYAHQTWLEEYKKKAYFENLNAPKYIRYGMEVKDIFKFKLTLKANKLRSKITYRLLGDLHLRETIFLDGSSIGNDCTTAFDPTHDYGMKPPHTYENRARKIKLGLDPNKYVLKYDGTLW